VKPLGALPVLLGCSEPVGTKEEIVEPEHPANIAIAAAAARICAVRGELYICFLSTHKRSAADEFISSLVWVETIKHHCEEILKVTRSRYVPFPRTYR
jgi:hypothetical protein